MTDAVVVQGCAVLAGDGLAAALDGQTGVLASVLAALLCCTVVCVTYVCIHEIERSLNFNLYNTDYLFVPRASRASTRGCSPARFLHCAIAPPRGFSAVTDKVVKKSRTHRCPLYLYVGTPLTQKNSPMARNEWTMRTCEKLHR